MKNFVCFPNIHFYNLNLPFRHFTLILIGQQIKKEFVLNENASFFKFM